MKNKQEYFFFLNKYECTWQHHTGITQIATEDFTNHPSNQRISRRYNHQNHNYENLKDQPIGETSWPPETRFRRNLLNTKCNDIGLKNAQKGIQNNSQKDQNMTKSARCWHAQVFTKTLRYFLLKEGDTFPLLRAILHKKSCDTGQVSRDISHEAVRHSSSVARYFSSNACDTL